VSSLQAGNDIVVHLHKRTAGTFSLDRQFAGLFGGGNRARLIALFRQNLRLQIQHLVGNPGIARQPGEGAGELAVVKGARGADAVTGQVVKVLPFLMDQQGRIAVSPSLFDRDAYQAFALPARAWEEEVFPARMKGYTSRWMDGLLSESGLLWIGCGKQKVAFCFGQDIELFLEGPTEPEDLEAVFPGPGGRYTFWELLDHAGEASRGAGGKPRCRCPRARNPR